MYGFQPKHARGKPAQALADGGLVHSITGMLGMRKRTPEEMLAADAKVQERNREAAARVAARAKPAQPAAPAEGKAVSDYAGMLAMQRREKEQGLADGGAVKPRGFKAGGLIRGPGTGTSDSIETEKKPGTFIMPARVARPKDKAVVEGAVGKLANNLLGKVRHRTFFTLEEFNDTLWEHVDEYNTHQFQKKLGSRSTLFAEEKDLLAQLRLELHP